MFFQNLRKGPSPQERKGVQWEKHRSWQEKIFLGEARPVQERHPSKEERTKPSRKKRSMEVLSQRVAPFRKEKKEKSCRRQKPIRLGKGQGVSRALGRKGFFPERGGPRPLLRQEMLDYAGKRRKKKV